MDLRFNTSLAEGYKNASQIARVLTEDWLARNRYCSQLAWKKIPWVRNGREVPIYE